MSAMVRGSHILPAPVGIRTGHAAVHDPHIIHLTFIDFCMVIHNFYGIGGTYYFAGSTEYT